VSRLTVDRLDIEVPPDRHAGDGDDRPGRNPGAERTFVVDEMIANDSRLVIILKEIGKVSRVWVIHRLRMHNLGVDRSMPFEAALTNAVPFGEIDTSGSFGPWQVRELGLMPLDGCFQFGRADLSVFKGISGILSTHNTFNNTLK